MTIFNLYIFDEKGTLIFYKEWLRKKHTSMDKDEVLFIHVNQVLEIQPKQSHLFYFTILRAKQALKMMRIVRDQFWLNSAVKWANFGTSREKKKRGEILIPF